MAGKSASTCWLRHNPKTANNLRSLEYFTNTARSINKNKKPHSARRNS